jgi:hypothetical protein
MVRYCVHRSCALTPYPVPRVSCQHPHALAFEAPLQALFAKQVWEVTISFAKPACLPACPSVRSFVR